jgi:hypothetical protein
MLLRSVASVICISFSIELELNMAVNVSFFLKIEAREVASARSYGESEL